MSEPEQPSFSCELPEPSFSWHLETATSEVLMTLDKEGMIYQGVRVKDAGEAYAAWIDMMNRQTPTPDVALDTCDFGHKYGRLMSYRDERVQSTVIVRVQNQGCPVCLRIGLEKAREEVRQLHELVQELEEEKRERELSDEAENDV